MADVGYIHGLTPAEIDKIYGQDAGTLSKVLGLGFSQGAGVPAGLIIPFNGGADPSGWSLFSAPSGYNIIGAGSTYGVGDTGGSTTVSGAVIGSAGSHSSPLFNVWRETANNSYQYTLNAAGSHGHTLNDFAYTTPYRTTRLIKSDSELSKLPTNGIVLGAQSFAGLSQLFDNDAKLFKAGTSVTTGGSNSVSSVAMGSGGYHRHPIQQMCYGTGEGGGTYYYHTEYAGSHAHAALNLTITPAIQRMYLTAWYNAAADFDLASGMIAMYESVTPPDGWYLCNGSNGTPDLRDYFVEFGTTGNHGTTAGNNTIDIGYPQTDTQYHHHVGTTHTAGSSNPSANTTAGHYHGASSINGKAHTPPYYALAFIMFGG